MLNQLNLFVPAERDGRTAYVPAGRDHRRGAANYYNHVFVASYADARTRLSCAFPVPYAAADVLIILPLQ